MPRNLLLIAVFMLGLYVCRQQYYSNSIAVETFYYYVIGGSKLRVRMKYVAEYWIVGRS